MFIEDFDITLLKDDNKNAWRQMYITFPFMQWFASMLGYVFVAGMKCTKLITMHYTHSINF